MQDQFESALKQLNKEQRDAVEHIDGPLLVIAGPGTGKTQLLSLRVANILKKTDTDASNILCLTFTNFAATNMRDRLNRLIGSESHGVRVQTFHSFAAEIMSSHSDYFWNGAPLTVAPDTIQLGIIQDILAKLPLSNPLSIKFAGQFTAVSDVKKALKLTKDAGLTPEKLKAMIEVNNMYLDALEPQLIEILSSRLSYKTLPDLQAEIHQLPDQNIDEKIFPLRSLTEVIKESLEDAIRLDEGTNKTTNTGKWKKRWLQKVDGELGMHSERTRNNWWMHFTEVYELYRNQLHQSGYYDYSDMLVEVITQLEQNPHLLAEVQEQYLYIMIDEFQDTNAAQLRLAHLVADHHSANDAPNLMAVGDDDQTIYAFNGAELNNMLAFKNAYPSTELIVLTKNYRSNQAILDFSSQIIEQAEDRVVNREADLSKDLKAVNNLTQGTIEHLRYPTREHQFYEITNYIAQLWSTQKGKSLAVLARNHETLVTVSANLLAKSLPIRYEQQNNILANEMVEQLYLLAETVQAIANGEQHLADAKLAALLKHPMWQINPKTLWELSLQNYKKTDWLSSLINHEDTKLNQLADWLMWMAQESSYQSLQIVMEYLLGLSENNGFRSPIYNHYLKLEKISNTYLTGLSASNKLIGLTNEFAGSHSKTMLKDFIELIKLYKDLDQSIVDESWFINNGESIELMTVHKAKGLEFDTVILLDCLESKWEPSSRGRKSPANLPLQAYGEVFDDYVRLMYVAATRAKNTFIVTSYSFDGQGKDLLATPLLPATISTKEHKDSQLSAANHVLTSSLTWPRLETKDERSLLNSRLENFKLTATGVYQFLDVVNDGPQSFLERTLLRVPNASTPQLAYGSAMHCALETAQILTNRNAFNLDEVLDSYEQCLSRQIISAKDFERYNQQGKEQLAKLFNDLGLTLPPNGKPEVDLKDTFIGETVIGGTVDHLLEDSESLTITDYKTGKPLTNFETKDQNKAIKAWRYKLQLDFYVLLVTGAHPKAKNKSITTKIISLDAHSSKELSLSYSPTKEELDYTAKLVQAIWEHVINLDFPNTAKYSQNIEGIRAFSQDLIDGKI